MAGRRRTASTCYSAAVAAFFSNKSGSLNRIAGNRLLHVPGLAPRRIHGVHPGRGLRRLPSVGEAWIHSCPYLSVTSELPKNSGSSSAAGDGEVKVKRKKLKGKRAVVRWLKFFRWKKKKEYERMTAEEKILYKLRKARKKEERLVEALKKIQPKETSETTHDPEILTPEEHFFFLKMAKKVKNYVPIGRRGIYQGVILNMHLHWKKHQTVNVVVKTFSPEEVKEIAAELARLTGGIVLDIDEENTIIMYRGKNYSQPPTEIMSPRVTLSRKKALDNSKYRDGLRAVRKYIPRLEQDLELLCAQAQRPVEGKTDDSPIQGTKSSDNDENAPPDTSNLQPRDSSRLKEIIEQTEDSLEHESSTELGVETDSEDLSDIFETDSETESEDETEGNIYLDVFDKVPAQRGQEPEDFEDHLRQISIESRNARRGKAPNSPNLDEVDRMFLRAASLLKQKNKKRP